jgi:hypothetical protein
VGGGGGLSVACGNGINFNDGKKHCLLYFFILFPWTLDPFLGRACWTI